MSEVVLATFVPLFDRLTDQPRTQVDDSLLDSMGLRQSLIRELTRLLNTRSHRTMAEFLLADLTVIDYGVPDFSALTVQSENDLRLLQQVLFKAVSSFEPRLDRLEVRVTCLPASQHKAQVILAGAVRIAGQLRRVDFDLGLNEDFKPDFLVN